MVESPGLDWCCVVFQILFLSSIGFLLVIFPPPPDSTSQIQIANKTKSDYLHIHCILVKSSWNNSEQFSKLPLTQREQVMIFCDIFTGGPKWPALIHREKMLIFRDRQTNVSDDFLWQTVFVWEFAIWLWLAEINPRVRCAFGNAYSNLEVVDKMQLSWRIMSF